MKKRRINNMSLQKSLKKFDKKFNFWNDTTEQRNAVKELFSQEIKTALESVVPEERLDLEGVNWKYWMDCRSEMLTNIENYLTK